jgi:hypothetical protein
MSIARKYGYLWVTGLFFLITAVGHWTLAWFAYVDEQRTHDEPVDVSGYVIETSRDMLENWQSEFLQLMWQVGGLAILLYVGSPQSREGDDRKEEKLDLLLRLVAPDEADRQISKIEAKYPKA